MADPVEVVAEALLGPVEYRRDPATIGGSWDRERAPHTAEALLAALVADGWRIVRTSTCACGQPDHLHGPDDATYPTDERIVDEWKPGLSDREFNEFIEATGHPEAAVPVTDTPAAPAEPVWCAHHRDGWCAVAGNEEPAEGTDQVPTVCGWFVVLPGGVDHRAPDCAECIAALVDPRPAAPAGGEEKEA